MILEQIVQVSVMNTKMQCAPNDCGVCVAATMTSIVCGKDPFYLSYNSKMMRCHLVKSLITFNAIPIITLTSQQGREKLLQL